MTSCDGSKSTNIQHTNSSRDRKKRVSTIASRFRRKKVKMSRSGYLQNRRHATLSPFSVEIRSSWLTATGLPITARRLYLSLVYPRSHNKRARACAHLEAPKDKKSRDVVHSLSQSTKHCRHPLFVAWPITPAIVESESDSLLARVHQCPRHAHDLYVGPLSPPRERSCLGSDTGSTSSLAPLS
jgi:hypothetical protein